jgi:hypothetical protein
MLKTKVFEITTPGRAGCDKEENQNITVISTNSFANLGGWGYIILYKE